MISPAGNPPSSSSWRIYAVIQRLIEAHLLANKKERLLTTWNTSYLNIIANVYKALGEHEEENG
jgi:hypothetical protein